jgi:preprotein translocase subunit SecF
MKVVMKKFFSLFNYSGKTLNVVEKYKLWFALPLAIIVIALIMFTVYAIIGGSFAAGLNLGIDFTGGTILTVELGDQAIGDNYTTNAAAIKNIIEAKGMTVGYTQQSGSGADASIVLKYQGDLSEADMEDANQAIQDAIQELFPTIYNDNPMFINYEYIGATTSSDLIGKAILSIAIAGALILLYIIIRFEIFSGVTAIIALFHDIVMIFCFVIITRLQINSNFIAVIITIMAYSINNTIVVFDRVRENLKIEPISPKNTYSVIVDKSIAETIGRSINTTVTTMLTILMLAILSVDTIQEFSLMIMVGLFAGTFSSLCIAPTMYSMIRTKRLEKKSLGTSVKTPVKTAKKA